MQGSARKTWIGMALVAALLSGCASTSVTRAPVEDRNGNTSGAAVAVGGVDASTLPGYENTGKPGYYTVRAGDTIMKIATEVGQPWRDIASWNKLDNPNVIEVGQVLRVAPPQGATQVAGATAPAASAPSLPAGSTAQSFAVTPLAPVAPVTAPPPAPTPVKPTVAAAAPPPAPIVPASPLPTGPAVMASNLTTATHDGIIWSWPASGKIIQGFNGTTSKGIDIAGNLGDPVYAAAAGRVVYAGSELRGFGKLIIVKHNDDYISVYAHNNVMLVKENETVKRGQKIAEMGSTDAPRVELHFEIRLRGKSIDPIGLLPKQP